MKRLFTVLLAMLMLLGITACSGQNQESVYERYGQLSKMEDYLTDVSEVGNFHKIEALEYQDMIDKKETFFILIGYPGCSWCHKGMPVVNQMLLDNNLDIFYMDIAAQDEAGFNAMFDLIQPHLLEKYEDDGFFTPMALAVKSGKIVDSFLGGIDSTGSSYTAEQAAELTKNYMELYNLTK